LCLTFTALRRSLGKPWVNITDLVVMPSFEDRPHDACILGRQRYCRYIGVSSLQQPRQPSIMLWQRWQTDASTLISIFWLVRTQLLVQRPIAGLRMHAARASSALQCLDGLALSLRRPDDRAGTMHQQAAQVAVSPFADALHLSFTATGVLGGH
jgi:hypothetical protein